MKEQIKIVFILPSLVPGGAERVVSFISQNLDKEKFNTELLIAGYNKDIAYNVDNIKVTYLNKPRVLTAIPAIVFFLFNNKPDIVFSSLSHLNAAMSMISFLFKNIKFIGREATVLSYDKKIRTKKRNLLPSSIQTKLYSKLDMLVCQSTDMRNDMVQNYGVSSEKIKIINNPISHLPQLKNEHKTNENVKQLITVGRLSKEKGHIRIIKLLPKLKYDYKYTIIGDGDEKEALFNEAKHLGVLNKINHIPFTKKVNEYISKSDLFLQGSYVEGFPNALLESCVVGTPAIAFNAPGGTKEIIENGINGFLVENEEEFLYYLHKNVSWNKSDIRNSVYKKFNKEKILKEYEDMFLKILNR